jgi:rSAM/selenodomain-associated transferase 2
MGKDVSPMETQLTISVVVPTLNEAPNLARTLARLRNASGKVEVIVVDGGSTDGTVAIAERLADRVIETRPGRAAQMNAGAEVAKGEAVLFLHADTLVPADFHAQITRILAQSASVWGRFDLIYDPSTPLLRVVAWMVNKRSCLTRICTGDQAIFVRTCVFRDFGQFADIPLMEDIEFSSRLRYLTPPACIRSPVITSSRRWLEKGTLRTILLMWRLRLLFWLGVPAERLVRTYYPNRT